jgi:hypothetical protein
VAATVKRKRVPFQMQNIIIIGTKEKIVNLSYYNTKIEQTFPYQLPLE